MPDSLFQSPQLEYASCDAAAGPRQSYSKPQKTRFRTSPTSVNQKRSKTLKNRIYRNNVTLTIESDGDTKGIIKSETNRCGYRPPIISAADLLAKTFPEPKYAVEGLLPEGLTVLVGQPKIGKSWLVLGIAVSIASGGKTLGTIPVQQGDALYLALEDGERRLQHRLAGVLNGGDIPDRLSVATDWSRIDDGGLEAIEGWLKDHPEARLVVVDTLQRIRPPEKNGRWYVSDYEAISPLADLAKRYGVAIVVVHHTRKQQDDDPVNLVSGSTGLTGAADGVCVLTRQRNQKEAILFATGRDFEERNMALSFDTDTLQWVCVGDAAEYRMSEERKAVIESIRKLGGMATPKAIAEALGKPHGSVRKMLSDMIAAGQVGCDAKHNYFESSMFGNGGSTGDVTSVTGVTNDAIKELDDDNFPF